MKPTPQQQIEAERWLTAEAKSNRHASHIRAIMDALRIQLNQAYAEGARDALAERVGQAVTEQMFSEIVG